MGRLTWIAYEHGAAANEFLKQYCDQDAEIYTLADIIRFNSEHPDISLPESMIYNCIV